MSKESECITLDDSDDDLEILDEKISNYGSAPAAPKQLELSKDMEETILDSLRKQNVSIPKGNFKLKIFAKNGGKVDLSTLDLSSISNCSLSVKNKSSSTPGKSSFSVSAPTKQSTIVKEETKPIVSNKTVKNAGVVSTEDAKSVRKVALTKQSTVVKEETKPLASDKPGKTVSTASHKPVQHKRTENKAAPTIAVKKEASLAAPAAIQSSLAKREPQTCIPSEGVGKHMKVVTIVSSENTKSLISEIRKTASPKTYSGETAPSQKQGNEGSNNVSKEATKLLNEVPTHKKPLFNERVASPRFPSSAPLPTQNERAPNVAKEPTQLDSITPIPVDVKVQHDEVPLVEKMCLSKESKKVESPRPSVAVPPTKLKAKSGKDLKKVDFKNTADAKQDISTDEKSLFKENMKAEIARSYAGAAVPTGGEKISLRKYIKESKNTTHIKPYSEKEPTPPPTQVNVPKESKEEEITKPYTVETLPPTNGGTSEKRTNQVSEEHINVKQTFAVSTSSNIEDNVAEGIKPIQRGNDIMSDILENNSEIKKPLIEENKTMKNATRMPPCIVPSPIRETKSLKRKEMEVAERHGKAEGDNPTAINVKQSKRANMDMTGENTDAINSQKEQSNEHSMKRKRTTIVFVNTPEVFENIVDIMSNHSTEESNENELKNDAIRSVLELQSADEKSSNVGIGKQDCSKLIEDEPIVSKIILGIGSTICAISMESTEKSKPDISILSKESTAPEKSNPDVCGLSNKSTATEKSNPDVCGLSNESTASEKSNTDVCCLRNESIAPEKSRPSDVSILSKESTAPEKFKLDASNSSKKLTGSEKFNPKVSILSKESTDPEKSYPALSNLSKESTAPENYNPDVAILSNEPKAPEKSDLENLMVTLDEEEQVKYIETMKSSATPDCVQPTDLLSTPLDDSDLLKLLETSETLTLALPFDDFNLGEIAECMSSFDMEIKENYVYDAIKEVDVTIKKTVPLEEIEKLQVVPDLEEYIERNLENYLDTITVGSEGESFDDIFGLVPPVDDFLKSAAPTLFEHENFISENIDCINPLAMEIGSIAEQFDDDFLDISSRFDDMDTSTLSDIEEIIQESESQTGKSFVSVEVLESILGDNININQLFWELKEEAYQHFKFAGWKLTHVSMTAAKYITDIDIRMVEKRKKTEILDKDDICREPFNDLENLLCDEIPGIEDCFNKSLTELTEEKDDVIEEFIEETRDDADICDKKFDKVELCHKDTDSFLKTKAMRSFVLVKNIPLESIQKRCTTATSELSESRAKYPSSVVTNTTSGPKDFLWQLNSQDFSSMFGLCTHPQAAEIKARSAAPIAMRLRRYRQGKSVNYKAEGSTRKRRDQRRSI